MKVILLALIHGYRRLLSPLFPPTCRFTPTCSQYALTAIEQFGPVKGTGMAIRRVSRCHPFHPGGYDPVPSATVPGESSPTMPPEATPKVTPKVTPEAQPQPEKPPLSP